MNAKHEREKQGKIQEKKESVGEMKFFIERASTNPIGDAYKLLGTWQDSWADWFAIIEIGGLDDLPKERFVMEFGWKPWAKQEEILRENGVDPDSISGRIILYDDDLE